MTFLILSYIILSKEVNMINRALNECPVCGSKLYIERLVCENCNTSIEGRFENSSFYKLNAEQIDFIKTFLLNRGNIKEIERALGISYPTVVKKLDQINEIISDRKSSTSEKDILELLNSGAISSSEAEKMLLELKEV